MKDDLARDKAIERLAAEKLRAGAAESAGLCPDAELVAAYVERTLTPRERALWEVHFDSCARCQRQIAELVRMDESESAAEAPAAVLKPRGRLFAFRWALAAPLLLTVVIAGLWYTGELEPLLHQRQETPPAVSRHAPTSPKAPEGAAAPRAKAREKIPAEEKTTEQRLAKVPAAQAQRPQQHQMQSSAGAGNAPIERRRTAAAPAARELKTSPQYAEPPAEIAPPVESSRETVAPKIIQPGVGGGVGSGILGAVPKRTPAGATESVAVQAARPRLLQGESPPAEGSLGKVEQRKAQTENRAPSESAAGFAGEAGWHYTRSPSPSRPAAEAFSSTGTLWRVGPHGLIQVRGSDGAWITKPSGVETDLLDIAFPRPGVAWVVGQNGTMLRSVNGGQSWAGIHSPTGEDLVRVAATSALSAQVTTRSGVIFSTADGGETWTRAESAR